jgi:hypothetical protein
MKSNMTYEDRMERMREYSDEAPTPREQRWMEQRARYQTREQDKAERDYERLMRGY